MKRIFGFLIGLLFATWAQAVVVYYQPTPYPLKKMDGTAMPQDLNIVHVWDGWITNVYYGQLFIRDDKLQIGGWGDNYRTYLQFDLTGLPSTVTNAWIGMYAYPRGDGSSLVNFDVWRPNSQWPLGMTWNTQPTGFTLVGSWAAGTNNNWWWLSTTTLYNGWKNGSIPNYGVTLMSWAQNNNFDVWRSSRYTTNDGQRPTLAFDITPTMDIKMPVPGGYKWLLTNEAGGYECMGQSPWPDNAHQGSNYYAIDISWNNLYANGQGPTPYTQDNTPILSAAYGKVAQIGLNANDPNGYFVVISHDSGGLVTTGFSTRYLHMKQAPARKNGTLLAVGDVVQQGDQIGIMGTTGQLNGVPTSTGVHLHFGVRYANDGASTVPELSRVIMEGLLLKSYQTECAVNSSGYPTSRIRYYNSSMPVTGL